MVYTHIEYEKLTDQQHLNMLRKLLAVSMAQIDPEKFKIILLGQSNDYLLQFMHHQLLENNGALYKNGKE